MGDTPADKWERNVVALREKCQAMLDSSETVRFVGAINSYGRTLAGVMQHGVKPFLRLGHARDEFFVVSAMLGHRDILAPDLGHMSHAVLFHEKVTVLAVPRGGITFYISISPDDPDALGTIAEITRIASLE